MVVDTTDPSSPMADILNTHTQGVEDWSMKKDSDGFCVLQLTAEGFEALDEVRVRRSKKFSKKVEDIVVNQDPYENYSPNAAITMLDQAVGMVKGGKYKKALDKRDNNIIDELTDTFLNMESTLPNFDRVCEAVLKLIRVGKSFYEYYPDDLYIDNELYDRVLAKYLGYGFTEPTGYVQAGKSKTAIRYPLLHNNMDKSYVLRSGDDIPEGVKETTKVEDWLIRCYKVIGATSETEVELELSPKIDGISVNGTIRTGKKCDALFNPQTRGDETDSMKIIGMDGIQLGYGRDKEIEFGLQLEAFVTNDDMRGVAEYLKLDRPYASNRHAASGIISRLCAKEDDELLPFLSFYPIETMGLDKSYVERMKFIKDFEVVPSDMIERKIIKGNLKELLDKIEKQFSKFAEKRESLSYAIDGMVITFVDDDYQKALSRNGRTNKYQLALKFDPASAVGVVKGIHLDSGNKGFRTIQVDLKHPVFLDGVRYDHVQVGSAALFEDLHLREDSTVNVHRVGDVIPAISVIHAGNGKLLNLPELCPQCGKSLTIKNKKLYCPNIDCRGNLSGRIAGFLTGIGMIGYADTFINKMIDTCKVTSLADLFELTEDTFKRKGLTGKIYMEFPAALQEAISKTDDFKIVGSIGIPDIGPARARDMLEGCGGWDYFLMYVNGKLDRGERNSARNSLAGLTKNIQKLLDPRLFAHINECKPIITYNFNTLRVGHTGVTLSDDVVKVCRDIGAIVVDGKAFDVLITGDYASTSEKMRVAEKNNIDIYESNDFIQHYSTVAGSITLTDSGHWVQQKQA